MFNFAIAFKARPAENLYTAITNEAWDLVQKPEGIKPGDWAILYNFEKNRGKFGAVARIQEIVEITKNTPRINWHGNRKHFNFRIKFEGVIYVGNTILDIGRPFKKYLETMGDRSFVYLNGDVVPLEPKNPRRKPTQEDVSNIIPVDNTPRIGFRTKSVVDAVKENPGITNKGLYKKFNNFPYVPSWIERARKLNLIRVEQKLVAGYWINHYYPV